MSRDISATSVLKLKMVSVYFWWLQSINWKYAVKYLILLSGELFQLVLSGFAQCTATKIVCERSLSTEGQNVFVPGLVQVISMGAACRNQN